MTGKGKGSFHTLYPLSAPERKTTIKGDISEHPGLYEGGQPYTDIGRIDASIRRYRIVRRPRCRGGKSVDEI